MLHIKPRVFAQPIHVGGLRILMEEILVARKGVALETSARLRFLHVHVIMDGPATPARWRIARCGILVHSTTSRVNTEVCVSTSP